MDIKTIQKKLSDNKNRKFRQLYIIKPEIIGLKSQGFSIRRIQKELYEKHHLKISIGSIQSFLKSFIFT